MMIFNWPDRCPRCEDDKNYMPVQIEGQSTPEGSQAFACRTCEGVWAEKLITSKEHPCFVAVTQRDWANPLAVLSKNPDHVRRLFNLDGSRNHVVINLENVLDAGEERVKFVKENPTGSRELWFPETDSQIISPG